MSNSDKSAAASYPALHGTGSHVANPHGVNPHCDKPHGSNSYGANRAALAQRPPEQLALLFSEQPPPQRQSSSLQSLPQQSAGHLSPPDLRVTAAVRLAQLWSQAKPHLTRKRMRCPDLQFVRGKTYAGRAHYGDRRIEINEDLLERHPEAMLYETIAHELAHLIAQYVHGQQATAHGREWQHVMRVWFGVEPERTHRFDMTGLAVRRQRRFRYRCSCQVHELTAVRHKRARHGTEYRCVNCTGPLQFVGAAADTDVAR